MQHINTTRPMFDNKQSNQSYEVKSKQTPGARNLCLNLFAKIIKKGRKSHEIHWIRLEKKP